jgi:hypothetical protein
MSVGTRHLFGAAAPRADVIPAVDNGGMASTSDVPVVLTVIGDHLPGRRFRAAPGEPYREHVHVGVQARGRPSEVLDPVAGDAGDASWALACVGRPDPERGADLRGPHIQGRPGGRFVYLAWGDAPPGEPFTIFRRAKLMLSAVAPDVLADALSSGSLTARLGLSDPRGGPLCAAVVPPAVRWTADA